MDYSDKMDSMILFLNENKKEYHTEIGSFIKEIESDPEERDFVNWNRKHFNSGWFFDLWDVLSQQDTEFLKEVVQARHMDYIINSVNWMLISRQVNLLDEKIMDVFNDRINMDFAKQYNPTYKDYIASNK
jgi:hypothetical protein